MFAPDSVTKICTKCEKEKPLSEFRAAKWGSLGKSAECKACASEREKKRRSDKIYKERRRQYKTELRLKAGARPSEEIKAAAELKKKFDTRSLWQQNAKQAFDYWARVRATDEQAGRFWAATGEPWKNPRLTDAEQYRLKYKLDIRFQLKERMRRQVNKAKKRDGIAETIRGAIRRGRRSAKVEQELGYSIAELMAHIERQFTKGMNWEKFKAGEIHIDHIIPQSSFDLADDDEWRRCWCLSNLRPMWGKENLRKRDAILFLC